MTVVAALLVGCADSVVGTPALIQTPTGATCPPGNATPAPSDVVVTVDPSRRFQTIQGFGTTERLFDDPHVTDTYNPATQRGAVVVPPADQDRILDALYVELGLTRMRYNPADRGGIEPVNDNADPEVTDLSKFYFAWKNNDGHMALARAVVPRGVTTYYAAPLTLESWMTEANPAEYVEWAMAILRRWRAAGLEMPYYSLVNEPGNTAIHNWSGAYLRDVTTRLGAKLQAEGFRTKLVVPDDITPTEALQRLQPILADPQARQYVGAISYHLYGGSPSDRDRIKQLAAQYGIPVWMSEYSQPEWLGWADTMHEMLADYDASAVDYMWGFFGQWEPAWTHLVDLRHTGTTYTGFARNKPYYVMGQYSRFVRPGAVRVGATSTDAAVKASAYVDGSQTVVVALNQGRAAKTVRVDLASGATCVTSVTGVRTSESENWLTLPTIATNGARFSSSLAASSITTFVAR